MLRHTKDLNHFALQASDGVIGHVKDLYFDDDAWVIRYFVVATGSWLAGRKVLISPLSVQQPNWAGHTLPVALTMAQIDKSPDIDTEQPVSRQHEEKYFGYYGYPYYWGGQGLWGEGMYPFSVLPNYLGTPEAWAERQQDDDAALSAERLRQRNADPHLRSCEAVVGYHVQASDGEIGHVAGFLVDEVTWAIRYLVVDTSNWWVGNKVLIAPSWISGVHWANETVSTQRSRAAIQGAPVLEPDAVLDRAWQLRMPPYPNTNANAGTSTSSSASAAPVLGSRR